MRRALVVGINDYTWSPLSGCINDANSIGDALENSYKEESKFEVFRLTSDKDTITKAQLYYSVRELFLEPAEMVIFFFSGHGGESDLGGYLVTIDGQKYDLGLSLNDVVELANQAEKIREIIIIIDACHSGYAGNTDPLNKNLATLRQGVSILSSSTKDQISAEKDGKGVFTSILLEAIRGGGADVMGDVTLAGIYNYIDKALGPWQQRPVFKAHVTELVAISSVEPKIPFEKLRLLVKYFEKTDSEIQLNPAYEPTENPRDKEKESIFAFLQKCVGQNLVQAVGEEHMYYAALNSKSCRLTGVGKLYWKMIRLEKI